jgi:hypothetical protein
MHSNWSATRTRWALWAGLTLAILAGCVWQDTLFVRGEPFVIKGTAALATEDGPCIVWHGQNGVTYQLFQGPSVPNGDFDRAITPGVTSRLVIAKRTDLETVCDYGTIVEVQRVLEIED